MKTISWILGSIVVVAIGYYALTNVSIQDRMSEANTNISEVQVTPISHATVVLGWDGATLYTDPTDATLLQGQPMADIVLLTDIHGDHLSTTTLASVVASSTSLIVPQAVRDLLPPGLSAQAIVVANGETITEKGFTITGIPMYNFPESEDSRHTKGRGNGYVIERDGYRVYVAGDTAGTPEMRALTDIDLAFVPMNLPFTMGVEEAADAVLDFKPATVYPYHYRGQDGLADVARFKQLVNESDSSINVILADWYPGQ